MPNKRDKWIGPIRRIQERVCAEFNVSVIDMRSDRRHKSIIAPRHIAMWISRKLTLASLPAIARAFNRSDHTTIIHAVRNAEILMIRNPSSRTKMEKIWGEIAPTERIGL